MMVVRIVKSKINIFKGSGLCV